MDKLPQCGGISLIPEHYQEILDLGPDLGWIEIDTAVFLGAGGEPHFYLDQLAARYPISMHCNSLSLGSAESVNRGHLDAIKALVERYEPAQFSDHLAWNRWQNFNADTLLPLPYNDETLDQVCINIKAVQTALGRRILLENPAVFLDFSEHNYSEGEFFSELIRNTGCGLLLNVNDLYVSSMNANRDPHKALLTYPLAAIQEVHISGHELKPLDNNHMLLVDECGAEPTKPVWQLYRELLNQLPGPIATLVERRSNASSLNELLTQKSKVDTILTELHPINAETGL